jgi:hypothetical protein
MGLVFLIHVQLWCTLFALRGCAQWNFPGLLVVLQQPVLAYLAAAFPVPDIRDVNACISRRHISAKRAGFSQQFFYRCSTASRKAFFPGGTLPNTKIFVGHAAFICLSTAGIVS